MVSLKNSHKRFVKQDKWFYLRFQSYFDEKLTLKTGRVHFLNFLYLTFLDVLEKLLSHIGILFILWVETKYQSFEEYLVERQYIKEIKHVFRAFIAWWKPRRTFGRIREQINENPSHLLENSHKLCRGFQQAMKARTTCFISFIKLLFSVFTKRKTIYEATVRESNHNIIISIVKSILLNLYIHS